MPTQEQTDADSFEALGFFFVVPKADGFRNYVKQGVRLPAEYLLVDRANLLTLSAPEMTVLVGGLRVLGANYDNSGTGVLTATPGRLTNDFFVNLFDLGTSWTAQNHGSALYSGTGADGESWTASRADLKSSAPTPSFVRSPRSMPA